MKFIPKVKSTKCVAEVGTGMFESRLSPPGEYQPGKLPAGGFQSVWNMKNDQPNDYFSRKQSPTSGGGKKVY